MKIKIKYSWIILLLALGSCNSWIDVKPSDRLSEDVLFADRDGFLKALNGIYVEMTNRSLYGRDLSCGVIDILGQYYKIDQNYYLPYRDYKYTDKAPKETFENVWQKAYSLIINTNTIIVKCDEKKEVLPGIWFGLVKGESLALRAMLHFDLLRLFGPVYTDATKTELSIPYSTSPVAEVSPLLSAEKVGQLVIADLKAALDLLKDSDPILTEGVKNSADHNGDNSLHYRQYRLNYYAVKALLARAYLWCGDKGNALVEAEEIIREVQIEGKEIFPFVTKEAATSASAPDRVFSPEVFFALYDINRTKEIYEVLYIPTLTVDRLLTLSGDINNGRIKDYYSDENDYRRKYWVEYNNNGSKILYNRKYEAVTGSNIAPFQYMVPLVRLSEVYLIAAECSSKLSDATGYLNTVRNSRGCYSVTPAAEKLVDEITAEFRREMLGEGQLFFFYKRRGMQNIPNGKNESGMMNMNLNNYVVPLPDSEISERQDN